MLSFCSHDYLCLSDHPEIKKGAIKFVLEHGLSSPSIAGHLIPSFQQPVIAKFSALLQRDAALFFPSHFDAMHAALNTFRLQGFQVFSDAACQAPDTIVFPHLNLSALKTLLKNEKRPKLILAESTFALTGDHADLSALLVLKREFDALLLVDDSHSFGLNGSEGLGACSAYQEIDLVTGSFDKACGVCGGYIACSEELQNRILESSIFPPLLSPPLLGALDAALEMIPIMDGERHQLKQRSHWLRERLSKMGFELAKGIGPLISLIFGSKEEAEELETALKKAGILVESTRLIKGEEKPYRVNLALTTAHTPDHLGQLIEACAQA